MSDKVDAAPSRAERYEEYARVKEQERLQAEAERQARELEVRQEAQDARDRADAELLDAAMLVFDEYCEPGVTVDKRVTCVWSGEKSMFFLYLNGDFDPDLILQCPHPVGNPSVTNEAIISYRSGFRAFGRITGDREAADYMRSRVESGTEVDCLLKSCMGVSETSLSIYAELCGE